MQHITFQASPGGAYVSIRRGDREIGQIRYRKGTPSGTLRRVRVYENAVARTVSPSPLDTLEDAKAFAVRHFQGAGAETPRAARQRIPYGNRYVPA